MSAHVLLNLLNELGKKIYHAKLAEHFISFSQYYWSTNVRFYLSHDIEFT